MQSVRITAAGAVALACLSFMTAPVRACDDRFAKQCEAEAAAAAEQEASPALKRKGAPARVWVARPQRAPAPAVAAPAPSQPAPTVADDTQRAAGVPDSPLKRRFRGFIDPQSMSVNAFEALQNPRPNADLLVPVLAMPVPSDAAEPLVAPDDAILDTPPPTELADAGTPTLPITQAKLTRASEPPPEAPSSRFPLQQLVLALCGALGAAAALRFIVGA